MDSTTLKVCRNQRIQSQSFQRFGGTWKVFNGLVLSIKLHLICNEKGELFSFYLTKGNVDDRSPKHIKKMTEQLLGKLFANTGYLSKALWEF